jgi:hypothetical protein
MIAEARQNVVQRRKGVLARKQEVEENLIRMERPPTYWAALLQTRPGWQAMLKQSKYFQDS